MRGLGSVQVVVSEEAGGCPLCKGAMVVEKSGPRSGQTLAHGAFDARETIHVCGARCRWPSGTLVTRRAASLSEALIPGSNYGLPDDETEKSLSSMREKLDALVVSLAKRRPARGPAQDTREAIDVILTHMNDHGKNLFGHAIRLPESAGGGVRLVARTNVLAENFFKMLKHDERRRSGRKNLGQDLEHLRAEAALVRNLEHEDYMRIVCGSLDQLPAAFAELDKLERQKRLNGEPIEDQEDDLKTTLQLASV
jgi:hypothetical protein